MIEVPQGSENPMLKQVMDDFDFSNPPTDPVALASELYDVMIANDGLGISANQVGLPYRVFVMRSEPRFACFNPRIVHYSDELISLDEGCISYPGLAVNIKRSKEIRVRFQTPNGGVSTQMFTGMAARVFQHEMDHLNGVIFYENADRYHKDKAFKEWSKWKKKKKENEVTALANSKWNEKMKSLSSPIEWV
jgi:peptide deformylase